MSMTRFYVLAAADGWAVYDREGEFFFLFRLPNKRRALKIAAQFERDADLEAAILGGETR